MSIATLTRALARRHEALSALKKDIELREGKLRMAKAVAADDRDTKLEMQKAAHIVHAGAVVSKVYPSHISLADPVILRCGSTDGRSSCYTFVNKLNPYGDEHFGSGCRDHCTPTFIRASAAKKWDRLARAMNRLLAAEQVFIKERCSCR